MNLATETEFGAADAPSGSAGDAPPSPRELEDRFPQLEILELLGRGGMGAVYKVRQKELDRIVALKILPPGVNNDPAFSERFSREARALAKLNHPNIVTLYEFGRADGLFFFLILAYCAGVTVLANVVANQIASEIPRGAAMGWFTLAAVSAVVLLCAAPTIWFVHLLWRKLNPPRTGGDSRFNRNLGWGAAAGAALLVLAPGVTATVQSRAAEGGHPSGAGKQDQQAAVVVPALVSVLEALDNSIARMDSLLERTQRMTEALRNANAPEQTREIVSAKSDALRLVSRQLDEINEYCDLLQGKNNNTPLAAEDWGVDSATHKEILALLGGMENDAEGLRSAAGADDESVADRFNLVTEGWATLFLPKYQRFQEMTKPAPTPESAAERSDRNAARDRQSAAIPSRSTLENLFDRKKTVVVTQHGSKNLTFRGPTTEFQDACREAMHALSHQGRKFDSLSLLQRTQHQRNARRLPGVEPRRFPNEGFRGR